MCLVETSGDLAPHPCSWSSDDDAVRELASCGLLLVALAWPRENLAAAAMIHLATKLSNLLDPDLNCFLLPPNLLPAPRSKQHIQLASLLAYLLQLHPTLLLYFSLSIINRLTISK